MSRDFKRKEFEDVQKREEVLFDEEREMEPRTRNGIVANAPNVNVRDKPSPDGKPVATLAEGTKIFMMETVGNYTHIRIVYEDRPSVDGYIHSDYCNEVASCMKNQM